MANNAIMKARPHLITIIRLLVMLAGIVFWQWQTAHAASFNCAKAATRVEKLICANHEVSLLDGELDDLYYYRMNRTSASSAEKEQVRSEQKKWLKNVRGACKDAACLRSAYEARLGQLAVTDIHQDWDTDGYWYFYAKRNPADKSVFRNTVLAYLNDDRSDVLLTLSRGVGIWVNKKRIATREELALNHNLFPNFPPQPVCDKVEVSVEDRGSELGLYNRIIMVDPKNRETKEKNGAVRQNISNSFVIFREVVPPQVIKNVITEDHTGVPLTVPIAVAVHRVAALNDCTFLAETEEGVIRFTADGTTQAKLPSDMRLVYGDELMQLEAEFRKTLTSLGVSADNLLQPRLWFFYRNVFKGE